MQISTEHGLAFLCMAKCASTAIESAITDYCNIKFSGRTSIKHINAQVFNDHILAAHKKLVRSSHIESVCMIRDPLDWIESWYRYRSRNQLMSPKSPQHAKYTGNVSYNEFLLEYMSKGKRKPFAQLSTQYNFLSLASGRIGLDRIIPFDNFKLLNQFFSEKFGHEIEITLKNTSPRIPISLDSDVEEKLRQYLAKDIAVYDFVKEHGQYIKALHSDKLYAVLQDTSED
ncbi:sulfotransferase family 2 domain-containing protein [bacterium]|nr:sulfotransferase family 2 domain-containing protein [bacterium]